MRAALYVDGDSYRLEVEGGNSHSGLTSTVQVSDRLASVERKLSFEDGSIFATDNNDAVDESFKGRNMIMSMVHKLESHMGWVVIALLLTVATTFSFFKWGVPMISTTIAHALPEKTNRLIAAETLVFLDKFVFEESTLDPEVMDNIRTHFETNIVPLGGETEIEYTLHFRDWSDDDESIANALALPSGDIVLTDEFVRLSESQDEIDSVLLHEMGHVVHRHSLTMVIQSTLVTTVVMLATGDSSGAADMGIGLGTLLLSTNYARDHESEADLYAFEHMLTAQIDPAAFSTIMARISEANRDDDDTADEDSENQNAEDHGILDYLSTHPSTAERIQQAKRYSRCFRAGLVICDPL